jgi:molecular chaperone Hsp33
VAEVSGGFALAGAKTLLGDGVFIMTVDQGVDMERYQGVTPIEGETLALCAEHYFAQSEQVPTRVRLAVGQVQTDADPSWRAGGVIIQNVAEDEARGSTIDAWTTAQALFETLGEDELVRLFAPSPLRAFCRCSQERIEGVLRSFPALERSEMVEDDGMIRVTCEYCSRTYDIAPDTIEDKDA